MAKFPQAQASDPRIVTRNVIAPDEGRARGIARLQVEDEGGWVTRIIRVRFVGFVGTGAEWTVEMVTA